MAVGDANDKGGGSPPAGTGHPGGGTASVSSGTASEALIRAASSVAEADTPKPPIQTEAEPTAIPKGDTSAAVDGKPPVETTPPATGEPKPKEPAAAAAATGDAPEARITAATRNARTQLLSNIGMHLDLRDESGQPRALTERDIPDIKVGMNLLRDIRENAEGFFMELGKRLGVEIPVGEKEDYTLPKPSISSEDGRTVYSADDVAKIVDIVERKITAKVMGEIQPLRETTGRMTEAEQKAQAQYQSRVKAGQVLTDMRNRPHFKEHEPKIAARLKAMDPRVKQSLGPVGALYQAYTDVLASDVFPSINTSAEQRVREENARKANGSAIVVPGAGGADPKKVELNNPGQLAKHMESLAAKMSA
jgi:hypothetical protein